MTRLRTFACSLIVALAGVIAPAGAALALTQTGPFTFVTNNWYLGPGSSLGFSYAADVMFIDTDGDGTNDQHHPLGFSGAGWTLRLTPSRQFVYAYHAGISPCAAGGHTVRLLQVPPADNAPLTLLTEFCSPGGIKFAGFFDAPATWTQRIAFVVEGGTTTSTIVHWVDLNTGNHVVIPGFSPTIDFVGFSPSGIAGVVRNEVNADAFADYDFVALCGDDFARRLFHLPMHHINVTTGTVTTQVDSSAFGFAAAVYYPNAATLLDSVRINDCSPPPTLGACCLPLGGCQNGTTEAYCTGLGGTWNGAGTVCATAPCPPPPAPDLHVTLSGQSSAQATGTIGYALSYSNSGNAAATSVTIRDAIPAFTNFVRATNGGGRSGSDVVWSLGTVAPGAAGVCSLYVSAPCNRPTIASGPCSITAGNSALVPGTGSVTTAVAGFPTTLLTVAHAFEPLATMPFVTGDKARYTLSFTNTLNEARTGLTLGLNAGNYAVIDSVLNAGGGTATPSGNLLSWSGTIGPLATATIVFQTRVTECRPPGAGISLVNGGGGVVMLTPCSNAIAIWLPRDTVRLAPPPVALSVSAPALGVVQDYGTSHSLGVSAGGPAAFRLDLSNTGAATSPAVSAHLAFGPGVLALGNPPFSGTPPAGTTWNDATKTIDWSGTIAAHDTVHITFVAQVDTAGSLTGSLAGSGDVGACPGALPYTLNIVGMRPETGDPHLLGLSRYEGLWTMRPGIDAFKQRIVGFGSDTQNGLARMRSGELWVTGSPTWRANPATGLFEVMNAAFSTAIDMDYPSDVAFDPVDSTLVFAGYKSARGLRVARWNPRTHVATTLYSESNAAHGPATHVAVDASRRVVVTSGADLLWIDPAVPGVAHTFRDTSFKDLPALAVDSDGNYLIVEGPHPAGSGRLASIDRTTGVFTVLHGGDTLGSYGSTVANLVVAADQSLYGSFDYGSYLRLTRPAWAFTQYSLFGYNDDLEWVGPPPSNVGVPPGGTSGSRGLSFAPPAPNPTTGGVTLAFSLPAGGVVRLAVYDLGGRRVRELVHEALAAGAYTRHWDGRDAGGQTAGPGLYFVRLETPAGARAQRLVIAR